jgi:hypothetical protein
VPVEILFKLPVLKPIVATAVLLLVHVPPDGKLLSVEVVPTQEDEENTLGNALTETVLEAVLIQPLLLVPVTV